ncbi:MAG TPA: hypothetical protein VGN16_20615, partial [Acidobacteriaceae bacterium]
MTDLAHDFPGRQLFWVHFERLHEAAPQMGHATGEDHAFAADLVVGAVAIALQHAIELFQE